MLCREAWRLADFKRKIGVVTHEVVTAVAVERGYQRPDGRELGGFKDGLRNASADRERIVFVNRDAAPDEPPAAQGGSYLAAMKITQDLTRWEQVPVDQQEQIIGRRKEDGSRLDLPAGTAPGDESELQGGIPPASHVAKAGPRTEPRDRVQIFRRGLPFVEFKSDGSIEAGLQFVSFQASMDQFLVIQNEWMNNNDFPDPGAGVDQLFQQGFAQVQATRFFFVPAPGGDFPGYRFFHPEPDDDRCTGRVAVRKKLVDSGGSPIRAELGGFGFQLFDANNNPVGDIFTTDSAGHALSPSVPLDAVYTLREVAVREGFQAAPDVQVQLDRRRHIETITNTAVAPNPGYR